MLKTLSAALAALLVAGAAPTVAAAATVTFSATPATVAANPAAALVVGSFDDNVTGSAGGARRSPFEGTPGEATNPYSAILGSVTYSFGAAASSLSLVWGSPDDYNTLEFLLNGLVVDKVVPGAPGSGVPVAPLNLAQALATFTDIKGGLFDGVRLSATQAAFEYAGLAATPAAVPLPATGLLLAGALGGAGLLRRRKAA